MFARSKEVQICHKPLEEQDVWKPSGGPRNLDSSGQKIHVRESKLNHKTVTDRIKDV